MFVGLFTSVPLFYYQAPEYVNPVRMAGDTIRPAAMRLITLILLIVYPGKKLETTAEQRTQN